jgi:hypothetical protein
VLDWQILGLLVAATPLSCASLLATRADQLRQDLEPNLGVSHLPWHANQAMIGIVDTSSAATQWAQPCQFTTRAKRDKLKRVIA